MATMVAACPHPPAAKRKLLEFDQFSTAADRLRDGLGLRLAIERGADLPPALGVLETGGIEGMLPSRGGQPRSASNPPGQGFIALHAGFAVA